MRQIWRIVSLLIIKNQFYSSCNIEKLQRQNDFYEYSKLRQCNRRFFFPQSDFQMPEKKIYQHECYDMVAPSAVFVDFVVIYTKLGFGLFETLPNDPPNTT